MSLKDEVLAVEAYVTEHVNAAKAYIAKEIAALEAALSTNDTPAITASLSNIKLAMDNLQSAEVEPAAPVADAATPVV